MNLADAIRRVRAELSDTRAKRWIDELFVEWFNDALAEIFQLRPELFQKTVLMQLQPGELQQPCNCDKLYDVEAFTDACGNVLSKPNKEDDQAGAFFGAFKCVSNAPGDLPKTFSVDGMIPCRFTVTPPVAPDQQVYARVVVAIQPTPLCVDDLEEPLCLDAGRFPVLLHYVKAMAYATEQESASSKAWFDTYIGLFFRLLGVHKSVDRDYYKEARTNALRQLQASQQSS
ncbi:hypothetical protein J2W27_000350 [Variovorax boronicumulans]|uniref:phage adaptor protein n=1 Tax=Variovorax boronicumulans TaxID=436515 RepID=UPI00278AD85C|nr:DUF6682 family protein [Variovorax boronicumulans]MDP9908257.1 hypothetical protein [Variovorax boronicumulans]